MGLFETPLVLGVVVALLTLFVFLRWRGRRRDEWRHERSSPPRHDAGDSTERP